MTTFLVLFIYILLFSFSQTSMQYCFCVKYSIECMIYSIYYEKRIIYYPHIRITFVQQLFACKFVFSLHHVENLLPLQNPTGKDTADFPGTQNAADHILMLRKCFIFFFTHQLLTCCGVLQFLQNVSHSHTRLTQDVSLFSKLHRAEGRKVISFP